MCGWRVGNRRCSCFLRRPQHELGEWVLQTLLCALNGVSFFQGSPESFTSQLTDLLSVLGITSLSLSSFTDASLFHICFINGRSIDCSSISLLGNVREGYIIHTCILPGIRVSLATLLVICM